MTCEFHNLVNPDSDYTALSSPNLVLTKTGNDLPFKVIEAGANVAVVQNANDITIASTTPIADGVHLGITEFTGTLQTGYNPLIFDNVNIPGAFNSGIYDTNTGVITIPVTAIYEIIATVTIRGNLPQTATEFETRLVIEPAPFDINISTSKGNQQEVTTTIAMVAEIPAGTPMNVRALFGSAATGTVFTVVGGQRSTLSINRLSS